MDRYIVVPPVPDGYNFFDIRDTAKADSDAAVTIFARLPKAERIAHIVCAYLNDEMELG